MVLTLVCLFSSLSLAAKLDKEKPPPIPNTMALETQADYVNRMIETIKYFTDIGYYTEASFLLSDLNNTNAEGLNKDAIAELQNKLTGLYSPEKENSSYNSDVLVKAKDFNGKWGYIDSTGTFVIEAKYDQAEDFAEGLALVKSDSQQYFINRKGETVIQFKPDEKIEIRGSFNSGLALCYCSGSESNKGYVYIDKQGKKKIFLPDSGSYQERYEARGFSEGFAIVKNKDLCGYIDTDGKWLVKPTFKNAWAFQNGMAIILYLNTDKVGYINTSGKTAFKPFIKTAWSYLDEAALIETPEGGAEQIDKSGNYIYDFSKIVIDKRPCFPTLYQRTDGLTALRLDEGPHEGDKFAITFVDKNAKQVMTYVEIDMMNTKFRDVGYQGVVSFANGRAFVVTRYNGTGIVDLKGNFIVKPQKEWTALGMFHNGFAPIKIYIGNGTFTNGIINRDGKIIYKE